MSGEFFNEMQLHRSTRLRDRRLYTWEELSISKRSDYTAVHIQDERREMRESITVKLHCAKADAVEFVQHNTRSIDRSIHIAVQFVQDLAEKQRRSSAMQAFRSSAIMNLTGSLRTNVFHETWNVDIRIESFLVDTMNKYINSNSGTWSANASTAMNDDWWGVLIRPRDRRTSDTSEEIEECIQLLLITLIRSERRI